MTRGSGHLSTLPCDGNAASIHDAPVVACSRCGRPEGRPVDPEFICRRCRRERDAAFERENRIRANRRLLETLADLWDAVPDQRFGQLVMNLSRTEGGFADTWEWKHGDWRERIEEAWTTWAKP